MGSAAYNLLNRTASLEGLSSRLMCSRSPRNCTAMPSVLGEARSRQGPLTGRHTTAGGDSSSSKKPPRR